MLGPVHGRRLRLDQEPLEPLVSQQVHAREGHVAYERRPESPEERRQPLAPHQRRSASHQALLGERTVGLHARAHELERRGGRAGEQLRAGGGEHWRYVLAASPAVGGDCVPEVLVGAEVDDVGRHRHEQRGSQPTPQRTHSLLAQHPERDTLASHHRLRS